MQCCWLVVNHPVNSLASGSGIGLGLLPGKDPKRPTHFVAVRVGEEIQKAALKVQQARRMLFFLFYHFPRSNPAIISQFDQFFPVFVPSFICNPNHFRSWLAKQMKIYERIWRSAWSQVASCTWPWRPSDPVRKASRCRHREMLIIAFWCPITVCKYVRIDKNRISYTVI